MHFHKTFAFKPRDYVHNLYAHSLPEIYTCHLHNEFAAVTAILIGGHKLHLSDVSTLHFQQLQRVLVVIWHCHLIQAWLVGQDHSSPGNKSIFNQVRYL